mmetsp:Transcript_27587/g.62588  ORF Transcript_27587/g.62588 Transcript_27587/m.62588 type:complete len:204 (-) Transcript_27587:960-1571(-)
MGRSDFTRATRIQRLASSCGMPCSCTSRISPLSPPSSPALFSFSSDFSSLLPTASLLAGSIQQGLQSPAPLSSTWSSFIASQTSPSTSPSTSGCTCGSGCKRTSYRSCSSASEQRRYGDASARSEMSRLRSRPLPCALYRSDFTIGRWIKVRTATSTDMDSCTLKTCPRMRFSLSREMSLPTLSGTSRDVRGFVPMCSIWINR